MESPANVRIPPVPVVKYVLVELAAAFASAIESLGKSLVKDRPFAFSSATIDGASHNLRPTTPHDIMSPLIPLRFLPNNQVEVRMPLRMRQRDSMDPTSHASFSTSDLEMNVLIHLCHLRSGLLWHRQLWETGRLSTTAVWQYCKRSCKSPTTAQRTSPSSHLPLLQEWLPELIIKNDSLWGRPAALRHHHHVPLRSSASSASKATLEASGASKNNPSSDPNGPPFQKPTSEPAAANSQDSMRKTEINRSESRERTTVHSPARKHRERRSSDTSSDSEDSGPTTRRKVETKAPVGGAVDHTIERAPHQPPHGHTGHDPRRRSQDKHRKQKRY